MLSCDFVPCSGMVLSIGWFEPIPKNIINSGINIPFCYIGQEQDKWHGAPYNKELYKLLGTNFNWEEK